MNPLALAAAAALALALDAGACALAGPAAPFLPDPLVWLAVAAALRGPVPEAVTLGWLAGLLRDALVPDPLGLHALLLGLAAAPAAALRRALDPDGPVARAGLAAAVATTYGVAIALARGAAVGPALAGAFATAVTAPLVLPLLLRIPGLAAPRGGRAAFEGA
ncbi:MAG: rod shape-determining protein MreD [Planctomycetales bacterium]|nr:rod shape-determining protein MreD [Planctomycetales bacterium]